MRAETIEFTLNGKLTAVGVKPNEILSDVLREKLGSLGTKVACDEGTCGSCTILLDGEPVYACMVLALDCRNRSIETVESLSEDPKRLHSLQQAFVTTDSSQCGFCTPGMIMSAKALLRKNSEPSRDEVKMALSGNICRCTDYSRYIEAVLLAAKEQKDKKTGKVAPNA